MGYDRTDDDFDPQPGWPTQTLTELEGEDWGEPTWQSYVVTNSHRLRKTPLRDFTAEDLRFMLGQQISLPILMPMALDVLAMVDPFTGGDMCPGTLLQNALAVDPKFWRDHPALWHRMNVILVDLHSLHELMVTTLLPAAEQFKKVSPAHPTRRTDPSAPGAGVWRGARSGSSSRRRSGPAAGYARDLRRTTSPSPPAPPTNMVRVAGSGTAVTLAVNSGPLWE